MIICAVSGFLFFSYKIGIEGKDAVISLKTHMEEHNYSERIGLQQWMDNHDVPEMVESWTTKFYESVSQYVDSVALQYNATEIVDGFKHYWIRPLESHFPNKSSTAVYEKEPYHPLSGKLRHLMLRFQNQEWKVIFDETYVLFSEFLYAIDTDDLVEKVKGFALQSIDVSKRVFSSGTMVLSGSANLVLKVALSIISGAAGLLNFVSQLTVFFWVLYYLITSESGGVMDHVLEMLPISKTTRVRSAEVLGHAVSSVLLATAKVALFQGSFTYLLFRFYHIHFLYVSTFVACTSAILPIIPFWLSSIPAAVQMAVETRYVEAVVLTAVHLFFLDYGTTAIQAEIPGQSAYLTGLSILGGMALFPSVLEVYDSSPFPFFIVRFIHFFSPFSLCKSLCPFWDIHTVYFTCLYPIR